MQATFQTGDASTVLHSVEKEPQLVEEKSSEEEEGTGSQQPFDMSQDMKGINTVVRLMLEDQEKDWEARDKERKHREQEQEQLRILR